MGWKPKTTAAPTTPAEASPTPPRRRRRAAVHSEQPVAEARPAPGKHSDPRPGQATVRLGVRWSQIVTEIKRGDYTWQQFVEGLSREELAKGQLKDANGGFTGRPPTLVPREFHLACQREMKRRFEEIFQDSVLEVAEQYVELAKDKTIPAKDRAKMMQYAMERIFGGVPKEYKVTQEAAWEHVFINVVNKPGEEAPDWRTRRYEGYEERIEGGPADEEDWS